jgi:hypothetical protein
LAEGHVEDSQITRTVSEGTLEEVQFLNIKERVLKKRDMFPDLPMS